MRKISQIASLVLVGSVTAILTGCGGDNPPPSTSSTSSTTPVDGYVKVTALTIDGTSETIDQDSNSSGTPYRLNLNRTLSSSNILTISGFVDKNKNMKKDSDEVELILKTKGVTTYTNPLTTIAVDSSNDELLKSAGNIFPEEANLDNENTKALVELYAVVAEYINNTANYTQLITVVKSITAPEDLNESTLESNITTNISDDTIKSIINQKLNAVKEAVNLVLNVENNVTKSAGELLQIYIDSGIENLVNEIPDEVKTAEINNTIQSIQTSEANAKTPQLTLTSIKVGDKTAVVDPVTGYFSTITIDNSKGDGNLSSYYDISIGMNTAAVYDMNETVLGDANKTNFTNNSLILTIKDLYYDNNVSFAISGVNIVLSKKDGDSPLLVNIPSGSKISVVNNGLQNLNTIADGATKYATVTNEINNTDLGFNLQTLIDNLSTSDANITQTIEELNANYFNKDGVYEVTLTLDLNSTLKDVTTNGATLVPLTTIKGKVKVDGTDSVNHTPTVTSLTLPTGTITKYINDTVEYTFTATDIDLDTITCTTNISWLTCEEINSIWTVKGTVPSTGDYNVTVTVSDGIDKFDQAFNIHAIENPLAGLDYRYSGSENLFAVDNNLSEMPGVLYYDFNASLGNDYMPNQQTNAFGIEICDDGNISKVNVVLNYSQPPNCVTIVPKDTQVEGKTFAVDFENNNVVTYIVPSTFF